MMARYLAIYNPGTIGRRGNSVYQKLVENVRKIFSPMLSSYLLESQMDTERQQMELG